MRATARKGVGNGKAMLMLEGSTTAKTTARAQKQSELAEPDKGRLVSIKEIDSITRSSMSKTQ